jgi:hypothetical protein
MHRKMSTEKWLAYLGLFLNAIGIAAFYIWPNEKWIGKSAFIASVIFLAVPACLQLRPFTSVKRRIAAIAVVLTAFVIAVYFAWPTETGNLKQRTTGLASAIQAGMQDRLNTINEIQKSNPEGTAAQNFSPTQSLSGYFYGKYLKPLVELREELATHHLRNQKLDMFIDSYQFDMDTRQKESRAGVKIGALPPMIPAQWDEIVKRFERTSRKN